MYTWISKNLEYQAENSKLAQDDREKKNENSDDKMY